MTGAKGHRMKLAVRMQAVGRFIRFVPNKYGLSGVSNKQKPGLHGYWSTKVALICELCRWLGSMLQRLVPSFDWR
jgi:hypothetical protein